MTEPAHAAAAGGRRIAVVNAYSAASQLPEAFGAHGVSMVHVQDGPSIPDIFRPTFKPERFDATLVHEGDLDATCARLRDLGVERIVPGTEYGIEFAERLAARFGTPTNPSRSVDLRRNKYAMIQALHEAGIPCARQRLCRSEAEVRAACDEIGGRVVVKPIDSAGSDGIHFCDAPEQAVQAFRALTARQTLLDGAIREVVVQSYLDGTEYYVNTMSRRGVHRVAEFWETTHVAANGRSNLLDSAILMPGDGEIQRALADYAARCLDALEVTDSPAHLEIRMTSQGPKLVELGARIVGGPLSRIARLGLRQSQLDLIAEGYCDERTFLTREHAPYDVSTYVAAVAFISGRSGVLRSYPRLDEVRALESCHEVMELVAPGSRIERTYNDFTYPLMVILAHPDRAAVSRDSRAIRHLDGADFYDLAS